MVHARPDGLCLGVAPSGRYVQALDAKRYLFAGLAPPRAIVETSRHLPCPTGASRVVPGPIAAAPDIETMNRPLTVLGIETSCDETAAAIVRGWPGAPGEILSNVIFSQFAEHAPYLGVVPEIAARAHIDRLDGLVARALEEAGMGFDDLDAVAVTAGPGLIGGVIVGLMTAKGIAQARGLPLVAVNHLEGHALSVRLTETAPFPYVLLLVSGGHCQLLEVLDVGRYRRLGTTIDDAAGEAVDKAAKLMGLGYPGGPAIEAAARGGDATRFDLPRPLVGRPGCDFSFSGLKTALRHRLADLPAPTAEDLADLAASFQAAVARALCDRTKNALNDSIAHLPEGERRLVVAGGVAANATLRAALRRTAAEAGFDLIVPPARLCTDNGAMIAWAGLERLAAGRTDGLDAVPRARWPLDPDADPAIAFGAKGRKA
jgi:N6-L-threonylcarbamoyladenine synthase